MLTGRKDRSVVEEERFVVGARTQLRASAVEVSGVRARDGRIGGALVWIGEPPHHPLSGPLALEALIELPLGACVQEHDVARERAVRARRPGPRYTEQLALLRGEHAHRHRSARPADAERPRFERRAIGAVLAKFLLRPLIRAASLGTARQARSDDVEQI